MKRFLFAFGYESPEDTRANVTGADAESSNAVWVSAASEEEAIEDGCRFADEFVAAQFKEAGISPIPSWRAGDFAHWISKDPMREYSGLALESFEHIQENSFRFEVRQVKHTERGN
jgi:hypothetical protein